MLRSNNQRISGGFPHSEIPGSKLILSSPGLIAEYHVLHRLLLPRHPPNALIALDLIRKKKDPRSRRIMAVQPASLCARRHSSDQKHVRFPPFPSGKDFCAIAMQQPRIWLVYLTWTTSLLRSDPDGSYWHRTPTRARPITPIISLNDVKAWPRHARVRQDE